MKRGSERQAAAEAQSCLIQGSPSQGSSGQERIPHGHERGREQGSAVVDFVLVGSLLTVFFMAVIQLALVLHVRNTLIDAAASGARYGTLADRGAADAAERTRSLIGLALNQGFAEHVTTSEVTVGGLRTLEVTVRAPLPVIGLIGPREMLEVKGHAAVQP